MDMNALARLGAQTRIAELTAEIESLVEAFPGLGEASPRTANPAESEPQAPRKRRKLSAATKAKIKAAWARRRAGSTPQAAPAEQVAEVPEKKRRTMSAAGKAAIAAAQKKRWAAIRKATKKG